MFNNIFKNAEKNLILRYPPEIERMSKKEKPYDSIREKDFYRKIAFWVYPSIDVTYFALKTLYLFLINPNIDDRFECDIRGYFEKIKNLIKAFVFERLESGFAYQTSKNEFPTLHALHCTIDLVDYYYAIENNVKKELNSDRTAKEEIEDFFSDEKSPFLGKEIYEIFKNSIASFYDDELYGFSDIPPVLLKKIGTLNTQATINATASALWCYKKMGLLEGGKPKFEIEGYGDIREKILEFVAKHKISKNDTVAYLNSKGEKPPLVCATYFAERILRFLNPDDDNYISEGDKEGILRFLISVKKDGSVFAPSKGFDANIVHTKLSMRLMSRLNGELKNIMKDNFLIFLNSMCEDIAIFMKNIEMDGGFPFAEKNMYLPNVYATRLAYEIKYSIINDFHRELGVKKPNFDFMKADETFKFIKSCFDDGKGFSGTKGGEGAFRGFSYDKEYIIDEYINEQFGETA